MKARKTMIAVAIATLIPLGAAVAGDNDQYGGSKSMHGTSFKKLDTNKDGRISQAEAAVDSSIMFSSADTNGDGYLDKDELKAAQKSGSSTGAESQSSQSPESSSPTTQPTDPNMQQGTEPSGNPSPDTETPRQ